MALFWYATWRAHNGNSDVSKLNYELQILSSRRSDVEHQLEALIKAATPVSEPCAILRRVQHTSIDGFKKAIHCKVFMMKPLRLGRLGCLKGRRRASHEDDFFGLKQEYDQYHEQLRTIEGYEKRLAEHKEGLRVIEDQAMTLWYNLGVEAPVSPTELKTHLQPI